MAAAQGAERDQDEHGRDHRRDRGADADRPLPRVGPRTGRARGRDERAAARWGAPRGGRGGSEAGRSTRRRARARRRLRPPQGTWRGVYRRPLAIPRRPARAFGQVAAGVARRSTSTSFTTMAPCNRPRPATGSPSPTSPLAGRRRHRLGHDAGQRRGGRVPRRRARPLRRARRRARVSATRPTRTRRSRKLAAVAVEARRRWPVIDRVALLHRIGDLALSEASVAVVVVVAAPARGVRGRPVLHRHPQGDGADLEARALGGRLRLGHPFAPGPRRRRPGPPAGERAVGAPAVPRPRDRPRYREHARLRARAGDHPQRADRHRDEHAHPRGAGARARRVADDRAHARATSWRSVRCAVARSPTSRSRNASSACCSSARASRGCSARGCSSACRRPSPTSSSARCSRRPAAPARRRPSSSSSPWPRRSARRCRSTSRSATWSSTSAVAPARSR